MAFDMSEIGINALYLLALINPVSKVSVLSVLASEEQRAGFKAVTTKSTFAAAGILLGTMVFGDFLLRTVFHVELYSLRLAGGGVLFWVGFNALRRGVFFEQDVQSRLEDLALVPLACPLIAGPATIAACITLRAREGIVPAAAAMVLAVAANYGVMRMSRPIAGALTRFNILGALIRITGLIVMTIGTQMVLDGLVSWRLETHVRAAAGRTLVPSLRRAMSQGAADARSEGAARRTVRRSGEPTRIRHTGQHPRGATFLVLRRT